MRISKNTIDKIAWWIPFKKIRNTFREYISKHFLKIEPFDMNLIIEFRKSISKDKDFLLKYFNLLYGLDEESIYTIDNIIMNKVCKYNKIYDKVFFTDDELYHLLKIYSDFKIHKLGEECYIYRNYILPYNYFEIEIFYDKYGINNINDLYKIRNNNIIDAGACLGDSSLLFSYYTDKNVYAFEPNIKEYNYLLKTIELNKRKNIIPVNLALGNVEKNMSVNGWLVQERDNSSSDFQIIKMTTLDKYVEDNNIKVGLIKTDLEGFEPLFLEGAMNTIKVQKPTLIISMYHNYHDFFCIKPMLDNLNLGYKFKVVKLTRDSVIVSTMLIAEQSRAEQSRAEQSRAEQSRAEQSRAKLYIISLFYNNKTEINKLQPMLQNKFAA